jgi:outer membrane protein TolC
MVALSAILAGCAVKPNPYSDSQFGRISQSNIARATQGQEALAGPIDLHYAMARALKYNLDLSVQQAQARLANAKLDVSHFNMLPDAVVNAGFAGRDNNNASRSLDLISRRIDPNPSTSQERNTRFRDISFSWNILDFGLSYVRATQAADRALIAQELQRNTAHQLLENVRKAYWHAIAYQRLAHQLRKLEKRTQAALKNVRRLSKGAQVARLEALSAERELIKLKQTIGILEHQYSSAKIELASLMNLHPSVHFTLAETEKRNLPAHFDMSLNEMMLTAARDRPEIRELIYKERIALADAKAAVLEILPGLKIYAGKNWDSNAYQVNPNWVSWGSNISWSLIRLFQYPSRKMEVDAQKALFKNRTLALTMSVLTQVHLSRIQYLHYRRDWQNAREYKSVQHRIAKQMRAEKNAARASEQELLLEEMNALIAQAKYDIAYADLQAAYANLHTSIGADPYGVVADTQSVQEIAAILKSHEPKVSAPHKGKKASGKKKGKK